MDSMQEYNLFIRGSILDLFDVMLNVGATVIYCSKITAPSHGSLSTDVVVFDTMVTVQCDPGFILYDGRVAKFLRCLGNSEWNDTTTTECLRMWQLIIFNSITDSLARD
jgi:Sushi repeat (SCR repeat)